MNGTASSYILESDQVLTHVYSLVSGYGDDHNHLFSLDTGWNSPHGGGV